MNKSRTPSGVLAAGLRASSAGTFLCAALASRRRLLFFIASLNYTMKTSLLLRAYPMTEVTGIAQ
jgi:hypothetical protein